MVSYGEGTRGLLLLHYLRDSLVRRVTADGHARALPSVSQTLRTLHVLEKGNEGKTIKD